MAELSDLTAACIRCGFCLESCPTFRLSGDESESPRGRIYLARAFAEGQLVLKASTAPPFETCLGCLACETACPSAVKYGAILEKVREQLVAIAPRPAVRWLLAVLTRPSLARGLFAVGALVPGRRLPLALSRPLSPERQEAELPRLPKRSSVRQIEPPLHAEQRVRVLRGCVMGVLYPGVHEATERLLARVGFAVDWVDGCCGALHAHSGYPAEAHRLASRVQGPVLTNSAGCGSWLRSSHEGVEDATVFLARHGLADRLAQCPPLNLTVAYQDACHLAHGQGVRDEPRALLRAVPGLELVELDDQDCCGSAGIYNVLQPAKARALLERKWAAIERSGATVVATGNPGCLAWIAQRAREAGSRICVRHTLDLLDAALEGRGD